MANEDYTATSYIPGYVGESLIELHDQLAASSLSAKFVHTQWDADADRIRIVFSSALTGGEKTTLDGEMDTWALSGTKNDLCRRIDAKCQANIVDGVGFEYPASSGDYLSLSVEAQVKWAGYYAARSDGGFSYPLKVRTKDDGTQKSLADAAAVATAYTAAVIEVRVLLDAAEDVKNDVVAAGTVAAAQSAAASYLS